MYEKAKSTLQQAIDLAGVSFKIFRNGIEHLGVGVYNSGKKYLVFPAHTDIVVGDVIEDTVNQSKLQIVNIKTSIIEGRISSIRAYFKSASSVYDLSIDPEYYKIKKVLFECFSDEEITTFCDDYFYEVRSNFTTGMTKVSKIMLLIDYAKNRSEIPLLKEMIRKERPGLF